MKLPISLKWDRTIKQDRNLGYLIAFIMIISYFAKDFCTIANLKIVFYDIVLGISYVFFKSTLANRKIIEKAKQFNWADQNKETKVKMQHKIILDYLGIDEKAKEPNKNKIFKIAIPIIIVCIVLDFIWFFIEAIGIEAKIIAGFSDILLDLVAILSLCNSVIQIH